MPKKKPAHGGQREGAGRKLLDESEGKRMPIAVTVPSALIERLDALAESKGWNRSEAITQAIRLLLK